MSFQHPAEEPRRRGATVAQLKDDIDSGRTGDKVGGFDPGASPLGTDDEAGGAAHDPYLVAQTRAEEQAGRPTGGHANAATPELQPNARMDRRGAALPAVIGIVAAAGLAALIFAAL